MKRLFEKFFVCEDGHVTVGDTKKSKCDAELWQLNYVKGKRKGQWLTEKESKKACGKKIEREGPIPEYIDYTKVWDYETMHAFLIGQKLDAEMLIGFQKAFVELKQLMDTHTHPIIRKVDEK